MTNNGSSKPRGLLPPPARYQIYRQMRAGYFAGGFHTDSPSDAVQSFLATAPAFEGGSIRLWDHHEDRLLASVEWAVEKTGFGFFVRTRSNIFHDTTYARIAEQITEREQIIASFRQAV